jgi:hypothetical protein
MADQMNLNINISNLKVMECTACGNTCFLPQMKVRFIPRLLSPAGQPQYLLTQEGIACATCGEPFDVSNPGKEEKEAESKIILVK